jgi:hypothetical protein
MKECDNSKIHISCNFISSISLLIMFDTLLLRPSLHCNTPLLFTTFHPTTLHYTSLHFTTLRPTTLHHTSPHFTQLHFTTLIDTSLPLIYTSLPSHFAKLIYISYLSIKHINNNLLTTVTYIVILAIVPARAAFSLTIYWLEYSF